MNNYIFIGYRTRPIDNAKDFMPTFTANRTLKDQDKINADIAAKQAVFNEECKNCPYIGTFDEVFLVDPQQEKALQWTYKAPDSGKPMVAASVSNYLLKHYADGWSDKDYNSKTPPFRVCGFNPRLFLKMLGLECSLPRIGKKLPLRMWYNNSEHRDTEEAVRPIQDFGKLIALDGVLKHRRPMDEEDGKRWDDLVKGWPGPGVLPEKDAKLSVELATQLGFLDD